MRNLLAWNHKESWPPLLTAISEKKRLGSRSLREILFNSYDGALVFHGCRPNDVMLYYNNGLASSNTKALNERAREIFLSGEFPEITHSQIDLVIEKLGSRDNGKIFACLDHQHLLQRCPHYMLYGSERICAIAAQLSINAKDYRQVLKRFGKPTILHVALDWEQMTESDLCGFTKKIHKHLRYMRQGTTLPESFFTFEFSDPIPGAAILKHEHPENLKDLLI